jgi:phospholipid/cholesterol/gamma-HCH transport system substrate-binding protein
MEPRRLGARPPFKTVGHVTIVVMGLIGLVLYLQFRGDLAPKTKPTMVAARAGLRAASQLNAM